MAKKQKTISQLVDEAARLTQRLVRLKQAVANNGFCTCVTCGKIVHWKEADGGHYVSRHYTKHKFLEENIHPQCKGCNRFGHKVHDDYSKFMRETYGDDFVNWLTDTKRESVKYIRPDMEEIIKDLKQRVKSLESEL